MSTYEMLLAEYSHLDIKEENKMPKHLSGLYFDNCILINKKMSLYEKTGVLAEEIGHHETTYGDITDIRDVRKKKLEVLARRWGYRKVVPLRAFIECYQLNYLTVEEICLHLEVTPEYLAQALEYYRMKYGAFRILDGYIISFDALNVRKFNLV